MDNYISHKIWLIFLLVDRDDLPLTWRYIQLGKFFNGMTNLLLDPSVMQFNGPCQHSIIYYILSFNRMKERYGMQSQELVDSCWVGVWEIVFVSGD